EAAIRNAVADREELPCRIEEKAKLHSVEDRLRELDKGRKAADQRSGGCGRTGETLDDCIDSCKGVALCGAVTSQARAESGEFVYGGLAAVRRVGQGRDRGKKARHRRRNQILFGDRRRAIYRSLAQDKPGPG